MRLKRDISIRVRLMLWYSAVLACALVLFAVTIWLLLQHTLRYKLENELAERTLSLQKFIGSELREPNVQLLEELAEYSRGLPEGTRFFLVNEHNQQVFASADGNGSPFDSSRYLFIHRPIGIRGNAYTLTGAISTEDAAELLDELRVLLLISLPAVMICAALGGWLLSRRALRPVESITSAVQKLSIHDLSKRLVVPQTRDELQRLAETWNSMLDRLEDAVQRLFRFTQDASHELRTPLAIIRSTAEIACRRSRSEEAYRRALQQIIHESDRLTVLAQDLLLLARGDSAAEPPFHGLDLAAFVAAVCGDMSAVAESRSISIAADIPQTRCLVRANDSLLRRLLIVLIDNAITYSSAGSAVRVSLSGGTSTFELTISDRGIGISAEELPKIFDRFYRGEQARQVWSSGSGLGLSLAASIARQHNAVISVASEKERGATFSLVFQRATP